MLNPLVILSLGGALHTMGHAIMVPLYWAVSGLLVLSITCGRRCSAATPVSRGR